MNYPLKEDRYSIKFINVNRQFVVSNPSITDIPSPELLTSIKQQIVTLNTSSLSPHTIINYQNLKYTLNKHKTQILNDWFGCHKLSLRDFGTFAVVTTAVASEVVPESTGMLYPLFRDYIFPWILDFAKVYALFKIAQAFYQENKGTLNSGKSAWDNVVNWGGWLVMFHFLPIFIELIDMAAIQATKRLRQ